MHATSLPPVADLLLATCVQSCLQMCVVNASRWFTYVRAQFWELVCTQSDQVQLTCCCCWTGCPCRPQACSWAELHCALYIGRAVTRLLHSNTQIVLWAAAYAGILQNQNLARQILRGRGESRRSILRAGLDLSCMYLAHHELGSVVIIAVIDILELPQTSGQ